MVGGDKDRTGSINALIVHPSFNKILSDLRSLNIKFPSNPESHELDLSIYPYPNDGKIVTNVEEIKSYKLDSNQGAVVSQNVNIIAAYDESIVKYQVLEGTGFLTCHSLTLLTDKDYVPTCLITFYFYTKAKNIIKSHSHLTFSEFPERDNTVNYVNDRFDFILSKIPENSLLLIDGPLLGGQVSSHTVKLNKMLLEKNIIPIFFVKNSRSDLVTENIPELKGNFNSDLHWAFNSLSPGERTALFRYEDVYNKENAKIFCYVKTFNSSPQRIEFHVDTLTKYKENILSILNCVFYLQLVQGETKNPQVRPIAISEKFARATLNLFDIEKMIKEAGLTPTINETRFR